MKDNFIGPSVFDKEEIILESIGKDGRQIAFKHCFTDDPVKQLREFIKNQPSPTVRITLDIALPPTFKGYLKGERT